MVDDVLDTSSEEVGETDVSEEVVEVLPEVDSELSPSGPVEQLPPADVSLPVSETPAVSVEEISADSVEGEDISSSQSSSESDSILDSFLAGVLAGFSSGSEQPVDVPVDDVPLAPEAPPECVGIETYALSPITSSTGLKGILLDVLGPYDNVVTQYEYRQGNNSYYSYVNEITPDYPWIASALLFIILLVVSLRTLGRCLFWRK